MKASINYKFETNVSHLSYYPGDDSLTIYNTDDEMIEVYGVEFGEVLCFARNFLVVTFKNGKPDKLCDHQISLLKEIKYAIDSYLNPEEVKDADK